MVSQLLFPNELSSLCNWFLVNINCEKKFATNKVICYYFAFGDIGNGATL